MATLATIDASQRIHWGKRKAPFVFMVSAFVLVA